MIETKYDKASITPSGIKYYDLYYSCSKAIQQQWFEIAWVNGEWEIDIIIENDDLGKIFLLDDTTGERQVCNNVILGHIQNDIRLQRYFESIKKLKKRKETTQRKGEIN
jgi:hypothetical protein